MNMNIRKKTVYCLRTRMDDGAEWSEPSFFRTRKERDYIAAQKRILAGIRTHSYEEKMPVETLDELFA